METVPQDSYIRKSVHKKLLSSHRSRLFQKVCDQMSDPLIISDSQGKIVYANPAYYRTYGYAKERIIGEHFSVLFPTQYRYEVLKQYEKLFSIEGVENSVNTCISEENGNIVYVEICYDFIYKRRKKVGMISVIRDVTSGVLKQRNREKYLNNAYHALKSPLATISTYLQLIQKHSGSTTEKNISDYLAHVIRELYTLNTLIDEWLDFTDIAYNTQPYKLQLFYIDGFIRKEIEHAQRKTRQHKIILQKTTEKEVIADKEKIGSVLQMLLTNAITYSPSSDTILVFSDVLDEYIRISVMDYGVGITKEQAKSIFENRFRRINKLGRQNHDIGLYEAKKIIHDHGGRIGILNGRHSGSTFFFELPLHSKNRIFFNNDMNTFTA